MPELEERIKSLEETLPAILEFAKAIAHSQELTFKAIREIANALNRMLMSGSN